MLVEVRLGCGKYAVGAYLQDSKKRTEASAEGACGYVSERAVRRKTESLQAYQNYIIFYYGSLAQLAEHLTLNQGVTGSRPVRPTTFARVAELAYALDLGSSGVIPIGVQVPSLAPLWLVVIRRTVNLNRTNMPSALYAKNLV